MPISNRKISSRICILLLLIIFFGTALRLPNLFSPLTELHDFRQTQTAANVWLYYKYGFKLFEYHVPMFGGKYWMWDFPLYQIVAFAFTQILGLHDFVGRLISILSYVVSSLALFYVCLKVFRKAMYSLLSVFLYSIIPINIYYYRAYIPDPFILSISLVGVALSFSLSSSFSLKKLLLILVIIWIGFISKITIISAVLLPIIYLLYISTLKQKRKSIINLIIIFYLIFLFTSFFYGIHILTI